MRPGAHRGRGCKSLWVCLGFGRPQQKLQGGSKRQHKQWSNTAWDKTRRRTCCAVQARLLKRVRLVPAMVDDAIRRCMQRAFSPHDSTGERGCTSQQQRGCNGIGNGTFGMPPGRRDANRKSNVGTSMPMMLSKNVPIATTLRTHGTRKLHHQNSTGETGCNASHEPSRPHRGKSMHITKAMWLQ